MQSRHPQTTPNKPLCVLIITGTQFTLCSAPGATCHLFAECGTMKWLQIADYESEDHDGHEEDTTSTDRFTLRCLS